LVLDLMEPIARGRLALDAAVARVVDLLGGGPSNGLASNAVAELPTPLADLPPDEATAIAADILSRASLPVEGGARQPRHIIQRLLAKANRPDPTDQVRTAFEFVAELHAAAGSPTTIADRLRPLLQQRELSTDPVDEVTAALVLLQAHAALAADAAIEIDLSLARGLRYYTGLVFEIYVDSDEGPLQVAGGGRYDDLVRALGGREAVPACGFSYGLERIALALPTSEEPTHKRILVVAVTLDDHSHAIGIAQELRGLGGVQVEQDVRFRGVKSALRHADRTDTDLVVIVGERERLEDQVVVRDMRSRQESAVQRAELLDVARTVLG
jgi:histidyl-tRNA synthetase